MIILLYHKFHEKINESENKEVFEKFMKFLKDNENKISLKRSVDGIAN